MLTRATNPVLHFDDEKGHPLAGGWLYTYVAGSNTPIATYKDENGLVKNETSIRLDSRGEVVAFLKSGQSYKFVVWDSLKLRSYVYDNVRSYISYGIQASDGISVEETNTDGQFIYHFSIADDSIAWSKLKSPRHLIADTDWIEFEAQPNSDYVVVSLAPALRTFLEGLGYDG